MTTLEQHLSKPQMSKLSDKSFLDFSNAKISKIGNVPSEIASQVQVLNLANNNLRSLEGIEQFKNLQSLSLVNNKISKSQGLLVIKNLLHLKKLSLSGNPFLENPLSEEILTLLGSYQNDLHILDFAFVDKNRQALINDHKRSKSQSRIFGRSQVKRTNSQEDIQQFSRALQMSKAVQKSKVNMLMSNMQQFIEEKRESQEISSYEMEENEPLSSHQENFNHSQMNFLKPGDEILTPMRKSPKFGSFPIKSQGGFNSHNPTKKFQQESTNIKQRNISTSKIEESFPYESRTQTKSEQSERVSWQKSLKSDEKRFPEKSFKYQVDNLKINMDLEDAPLNYPSIIQKEDQDSYQIEFDFMSPRKTQSPSKSKLTCSQVSPSQQLKGLTHSYVKIQDDEVREEEKEEPEKEHIIDVPPIVLKTERPQVSSGTLAFITKSMTSQNSKVQKKTVSKVADKQNYYQKRTTVETPTNVVRKGSLYESTRSVGPQQMSQDFIHKLLNQRALQQGQSFSSNFSLGEMLQNAQKFQKFYYTSLTRLKPTFSLLYSPFNSLKTQEKDLLLQELFRNHKQIFILLIREFYTKEKLEQQLSQKSAALQIAQHQLSETKVINAKIKDCQKALAFQKSRFNQIDMQNRKLKRYIDQFEDILASREKIINDTKRQYEKASKVVKMKEQIIQKSLNEDEIQEKIIELSEARIKNHFLKIIQKRAQWALKFQNFILKRQQKQHSARQTRQRQLKKIIFQSLQLNLKKENSLKDFISTNENKKMRLWFHEWKIQTKISKIENQFEHQRTNSQKRQFLTILNEFYLNRQRKQKINDINKIRIQRKVFYEGFKKNCQEQKIKKLKGETQALKFLRKNFLQTYFHAMKSFVQDQQSFRLGQQKRIQKEVILKNQFALFRRIYRYQNKQQEFKFHQVSEKIIKSNEVLIFLRKLKIHSQISKRSTRNQKVSVNYRLKRIFKALKKFMKKNVKLQHKFQDVAQKIIHEKRLKTLVVQFRQNLLREKLEKIKKKSFYEISKKINQDNQTIQKKKSDVLKILDFRRGLRAKNELISLLRHENMKKKMTNKRLVMQHHYLVQESKYKQSYKLNILTMQQLKEEIQTYLKEIEFYKLQVQKLSQRELFILQEKENCLLEIQCKEEENLELKKAVLENEQKLEQLQRKYQKSLDMYAAVMDEMEERQRKMQKSFLYNTMLPTEKEFQTSIRKQPSNQGFSSLKR